MGPHDDELDYIAEPAAGTLPVSRVDIKRGALRDIGGYRVSGNGGSQSVEIPPNAEYFTCFAEDGDARLDIGRDATSSSSIFVAEDVPLVMYPISRDQGLSCLMASGDHASFRFFGRSYME